MVKGRCGKLYAVKLFPKETCQCPSGVTGRCYHILAAKKSINMPTDSKTQTVSLTQLRKRSRSRPDKKSGRKKPRAGDIDSVIINPAPDSIMATTILEDINENDDWTANPNYNESTPKIPSRSPQTPKSILKNKQEPCTESKKKLRFDKISSKLKDEIPPKTSDLPDLEEINKDLIDLSRSFEQDECPDKSIWVKPLSLYNSDKFLILNNKKLTSDHMEAVNILARKQFQNIKGLQLTVKVPEYIKAEKRWHAGTVMNPVTGLACQIHHTSTDHWVASFQENDEIFLFDSLGTDRPLKSILTPSLQIQLAILYGKDKSSLNVILPDTQRQNNGYDCGLFAIGHLIEFCSKGMISPNVIFDTTKMRKHLATCLETECLLEFPKTEKSLNMRRKKEPKHTDIPLVCMCNLPECLDDVVKCGQCNSLFHKHCVVAPTDISKIDKTFECENCST